MARPQGVHRLPFKDRPGFNELLDFIEGNKGLVKKIFVVIWNVFSRDANEAKAMIKRLREMNIKVDSIEQPIDFSWCDAEEVLTFYIEGAVLCEQHNVSSK